MSFLELWAYHTSTKATIRFTSFQLVYGLEAVLLIEYKIPSLKLVVERLTDSSIGEVHFLYLNHLDEHC